MDWKAHSYSSPRAYFEAVFEAYCRARQAGEGEIRHSFRIGGHVVCLHFASPALVGRIIPALQHLKVASDQARLDVFLWDSASTRTTIPRHPWSGEGARLIAEDFQPQDGRIYYNDGTLRMYFYLEEMALFLDRDANRAIFWVPDAELLPVHETAAPLRSLLQWWFSAVEVQFVHGAGVGRPQGGVLMVGRGGSGKSTTTLACLGSGLQIAGDDYCLISNQSVPVVHSLYCSAKVVPSFLPRLPLPSGIAGLPAASPGEKSVVYLCDLNPAQVILQFPLLALLIPRITGGVQTCLSVAPAMHALRALAPSTIFQLVEPGAGAFQALATLVKQVPSYFLDLGTDLQQIPGVILQLLDRLEESNE